MKDLVIFYAFIGWMDLSILATFVYMIGFNQLRATARRTYQTYTRRPR